MSTGTTNGSKVTDARHAALLRIDAKIAMTQRALDTIDAKLRKLSIVRRLARSAPGPDESPNRESSPILASLLPVGAIRPLVQPAPRR